MKYILILIVIVLSFAQIAFAITDITIHPDSIVPLDNDFVIPVTIDAHTSINTISGSIVIPKGITVKRIEDGNSVVSLWIEKPYIDTLTGTVSFSGIIPGGFMGKGLLLKVIAQGAAEGLYDFEGATFDVYKNSVANEKDLVEVYTSPFAISVNGKVNSELTTDNELPESFGISIVKDELLGTDKWVAIFSTQDKLSGISHYEIAERRGERITNFKLLKWHETESPVILDDQDLKSFVYIKAVDNTGNERVQILEPRYPVTPLDRVVYEFLPILLIALAVYLAWRLWRTRFTI